ncbi:ParB N-terminal domain-containing protein [Almyronema epifaneia]|uniref:ParB N-terminal domain-containing protein n=1 Tax=Almyronema epifaneia S1 TaxID=2991925 RepID=A0ABW6IMB2_9CYAN
MSSKRKSLNERAFVFGDRHSISPELQIQPSVDTSNTKLQIDQIHDRHLGNTRELDAKHVAELADSIAALGLIEPLVVDSQNRLLAGSHRRAAILYLRETEPDTYAERFPAGQIPVQIMPFNSELEPDRALAVEAAENEKRRDYTPTEIKAIAEKLRSAGYEDLKGRPKKGQKPLIPALSVVVGKSMRTVQRHLYGDSETASKKSTTDDALFKKRLLQQVLSKLQTWKAMELNSEEEKLVPQMEKLSLVIEEHLAKSRQAESQLTKAHKRD